MVYAVEASNAPHRHRRRRRRRCHHHHRTTEMYLVAFGQGEVRVERATVRLEAGDPLVEPGKVHSVLASARDSFCVDVHVVGLPRVEAWADSEPVSRVWLGG